MNRGTSPGAFGDIERLRLFDLDGDRKEFDGSLVNDELLEAAGCIARSGFGLRFPRSTVRTFKFKFRSKSKLESKLQLKLMLMGGAL